ncbi:helix-turn-helix domain-containing protein [Eoetvoesiella caeni]|uniref:Regulatory LuxR family protein n=1 Tax=Eoetvoesiella caeni TaxID=645616 RepID=A0A366HC19_9BURK|nr:helix-turn-helix domain-containing protein [Eoetvoesiella caeni]MCI2809344.1 helix-turn-helix domain-containing protein [Eoetvoesiella caeni]NYT54485.1 helix-turn-helix domain-containing protein [Eoetvoesiella caeni]RBP39327.1 hypothetical protein DFR37_105120 [Eoetvoesiella caeni]
MNAIAHIVGQHLHVALLPPAPEPEPKAGPSGYVLKWGPPIAKLKAEGMLNADIAKELGLTRDSVASIHSRYVREKL